MPQSWPFFAVYAFITLIKLLVSFTYSLAVHAPDRFQHNCTIGSLAAVQQRFPAKFILLRLLTYHTPGVSLGHSFCDEIQTDIFLTILVHHKHITELWWDDFMLLFLFVLILFSDH